MNPVNVPRLLAAAALAGTAAALLGWLASAALAAGWPALLLLAAVLAPLAFGLRGVLRRRLRTARWLSLVLPFYGAAFLVGAAGNSAARGWVTAGAFCAVLAFGASISWVRRSGGPTPPRSPT
jgi:uncharacterized membrane protein